MDQIETPCFGHIGSRFDLTLTGVRPWHVTYEIQFENTPPTSKTVIVQNPSDRIDIKPPKPGLYTVKFISFQDSKFPAAIPIEGLTYTQVLFS